MCMSAKFYYGVDDIPKAKNAYRTLGFSTAATIIKETVEMLAITMMCFGRSFCRSDEKQHMRTITSATQSG